MNMDTEYSIFFITAGTREEAERIASELVQSRCAACVSIVPQIYSTYWWEGQIESSQEVLLIGKTLSSCHESVMKKVKELHSYNVPEIIFTSLTDGYKPYLNWLSDSAGHEKHH